MKPNTKQHLISLIIGLFTAYAFMVFHSFGSTDPNSFGFYWSLFMGLFISFYRLGVKKFQKKPRGIIGLKEH